MKKVVVRTGERREGGERDERGRERRSKEERQRMRTNILSGRGSCTGGG